MGCRAPQTLPPERGLGRAAGGRRRRGRRGCPDAGHAVRRAVRVLCPPCGRTSVQLVGRTSGVQGERCPRDRGDLGVRTDRRPVSAASAAALSAPRWIRKASVRRDRPRWRTGLEVSLWSVSGLVVAARVGSGGEGMVGCWQCVARTSVDGRPGPPLGMRAGCGAALAAWLTHGGWSSARCRPVGGGAGEGAGAHKSPGRCVLGGLPA
jgi:hypothetical protein